MPNIIDILARAQSLMNETALNSITPPRAGGIMYDTLLVLNQMQLEGASLLISKVYASVSAMEADTTPTSDLTGRALKPGQLVVIVTSSASSSDMGSEYRYNGPGSWTYVGKVGGLPLDTVPTQNSTKGITSGGVYTALAAMKAEGYKYMGLATPGSGGTSPGTPNQPVFYIAGPGSYPNFGSITVASGYLGFIKYSSGSWSVESVAVGKDYDAQISALDGQISQLEAEVHNLSGKYYGVFADESDLPDDAVTPGYAFVGAENPYAIWNVDGDEWSDSGSVANGIYGEPGVGFDSAWSLEDGTFVIVLTSGDTITFDLNHNHPNYFDKLVGATIPSGGLVPDVAYKLGTLTGAVTITLASAVAGCLNHYFFTFDTSASAPTITFPVSVTKWDGNCVTSNTPVISASKHYEVSILDGVGVIYES